MRRSLEPRHRTVGANTRLFSLLFAALIVAAIIFFARGPIGAGLRTVLGPVWRFEFFLLGSLEDAANIVRSKRSLMRENIELKADLVRYDELSRAFDDAIEKNAILETMLGRYATSSAVAAVVLRRPPYTLYDTLLVDVGRAEGLGQGDLVVTEGFTLVGDIAEVNDGSALVSLFSTPGRETEVLIGDSTQAATAIGRGGGNFVAMLPVDIGVEVGDEVKLPSLDSSVLGLVEYIDVDSADSIQTVYFKNIFNVSDLDIVLIRPQ